MAIDLNTANQFRSQAGLSPLTPEQFNAPISFPINSSNTANIIAQRKAALNPPQVQQTTPSPSLGDRVANSIQSHGEEAQRIINDPTEGNPLTRGVKAAAQSAEAVASPITETAKSVWDTLPTALQQFFTGTPEQQQAFQAKQDAQPATGLDKALFNWSQEHPDAYNSLKNTLGGLGATGEIAGTIASAEAVPDTGITKVSDIPGEIKSQGQEFLSDTKALDKKVGDIRGNVESNNTQKQLDSISEKISPKPTTKEVRLAQSQGRIIPGKEPGLLVDGTPPEIIPIKDIQHATGTIYREIPGASDMNEIDLTNAINDSITTKAETLKPQMESTPVKPETINKINDDWENLKAKQVNDADATEEANVKKLQDKFQKNYLESTKTDNLNDLWETAKDYDESIPEKVKKANDTSDISLQNKKEMWLQNRSILRKAITDSSSGLGEESQQVFNDMHDMYNARENLISKAKVETTGKPGTIKRLIQKNPKIAATVGGAVLGSTAVGLIKH